MPVAAASAIHPPSLSMDDRKRPAAEDLSSTPPLKKQVTRAATVNGTSSHPDHDMPWKDDIERYQKYAPRSIHQNTFMIENSTNIRVHVEMLY